MGTDWRDNDPAVEPLVEIYQGDRVSAEYEGAPKAANAQDPASAPGGFRPAGYVWNAWAKGYKLGIQASSDHLSTHISYACTIATDSTREGLLDAMQQRHSYGATDNIILDYRLQTGGKEYLQGDIVKAPGEFKLMRQNHRDHADAADRHRPQQPVHPQPPPDAARSQLHVTSTTSRRRARAITTCA